MRCQVDRIRGFDFDPFDSEAPASPPEVCDSEATHTNCLLEGAVTCAAHKCRCAKLLPSAGTTWLKEFEALVRVSGLPWHDPSVTRDADGMNLEWRGDRLRYPRRMGALVDGPDTGCWLVSRYEPCMDGPHDLTSALAVYAKFIGGPSWDRAAVYQWKRFTRWLTSR